MALTFRKGLSVSLSLGIVVLLATQVFADGQMETPDSPYVMVSGGWVYVPNVSEVKLESRSTYKEGGTRTYSNASITQLDYQFDLGFDVAVTGSVGFDFRLFRLEGEVSHASAGFKGKITHSGYSSAQGDDTLEEPKLEKSDDPYTIEELRLTATRLLANVYYDVETGTRFRPYAGIGVGAVQLSIDAVQAMVSGWTLAYQGLAGVGVELVEGVDIRLGYRFVGLGLPEYSLERRYSQESTINTSTAEVVMTVEQPIILTHQVELGVSYSY